MHTVTVDERVELVSLVFRLAGLFSSTIHRTETPHHEKLELHFKQHKRHQAMKAAKKFKLYLPQIPIYALHLAKHGEDFVFVPRAYMNLAPLYKDNSLLNPIVAAQFTPLLNDFYQATQFGAFFHAHSIFYEKQASAFAENYYHQIDLAWFSKYIDPTRLRCVFTPSLACGNFGVAVAEAWYSVVSEGMATVHEICHLFANPIAEQWYEQNPAFRQLCDEPMAKWLPYERGVSMATEYVTRSYDILYQVQHGDELATLLQQEQANGFPHIEQVYNMVKELP
ncbi:MAG: DUF4932 domain-containing protein [Oscillospiraceae bacterium]|nr:DUF4932 domain-containing protein [Oscillospiraceae bacterium]